jgi:hypothetical protein
MSDLWTLDADLTSEVCAGEFDRAWRREARKPSPSIATTFFNAFPIPLFSAMFFKAANDVLTFVR